MLPDADKTTRSDDRVPSTATQTDEQLMVAFARGQVDAFSILFLRYKQPLFGFFRRRTSDSSLAEELTQETFLALLRGIVRYEASSLFRTYLYAIGFKILRTHRRKAAFRAMFWTPQSLSHEPSTEVPIETELFMRQALRKMEEMDREILMLREFEGLSYAEVAVVLDLPVNTVRSRLFRARTALRDLLATRSAESTSGTFRPLGERV